MIARREGRGWALGELVEVELEGGRPFVGLGVGLRFATVFDMEVDEVAGLGAVLSGPNHTVPCRVGLG